MDEAYITLYDQTDIDFGYKIRDKTHTRTIEDIHA